MNWIDILILIIISMDMLKGYSLGLMLSLFNILQVIISLFITKNYYMGVYKFIISNEVLLSGFNRVIYFFFRIIFYRKDKLNPGFLDDLMKTSVIDMIILGFSVLLIYKISTIIIDILFSLFSFILDVKIFKKIDRYGGMLFGLLKGVLTIIIINGVLRPVLLEMPELMLSKAFFNSELINLLMLKMPVIEEGIVYEKTRYFFWNIIGIYRSVISSI